jgi:integrase
MPSEAKVSRNGTVTWTVKGKKRTGKLSGTNRVSIQSDTWTAQFTDETGKSCRVSTKTTNRSVAEKILAKYQTEVDRIRTGVATREELDKAQILSTPLDNLIEQYRTKLIAEGRVNAHIKTVCRQIEELFHDCEIDNIAKIRRKAIERWVADEKQRGKRALGTINAFLGSVKAFVQYLTDIGIFANNPLKSIRFLNAELDRRKVRRAMTEDEIERLMQSTATGKQHKGINPEERILIYRLLLGTGLRSTELSLLTPSQINFEHCRLTIEAKKTKNKKADILPLKPSLVQSLKERIEANNVQVTERIFLHDHTTLLTAFYADLQAARIERKSADGRSLDVHSLRKTFGTLLAMAGVPLTTVQRLMRHSSPLLTAKLYIDVDPLNMAQALEKLPEF